MFGRLKRIDVFTRNIFIVFAATSLVNLFNLLYQLLIAHRLPVESFAAFNSLLSIFMIISAPLLTIQMAVAKYSSEFSVKGEIFRVKLFLNSISRKMFILAAALLFIFWLVSGYIIGALKISSIFCGYILALLIGSSFLVPVFAGGLQGLELFGWLSAASLIAGIVKLALAFIFINIGFDISGALASLLISILINLIICYFPLRYFLEIKTVTESPVGVGVAKINTNEITRHKEIFTYLIPVAISNFCFMNLVSFDMVLVKYFFADAASGLYSLAQMVGKIFLFLPGAISVVMFPRTSGLNARNMETASTLARSLWYALGLCILASLFYNLFPEPVLRILTGKIYAESILLGRLFSISMSLFALLYVLISYFLSIKDLRFIKYLVLFTFLQGVVIFFFHQTPVQVQLVLCANSFLLFLIHLFLAYKKTEPTSESPCLMR